MKLGELEELVLISVNVLGGNAYGVPIRKKLEIAGREVTTGALYVTLERMEEKGMITSREGEPTPERGGRAKIYYRVTDAGVNALKEAEEVRKKLRGNLDK